MSLPAGSVPDLVANYIKEGITSGKWSPGEKLPSESELCRQLTASRVSVRTAISRLAGLGIVESYQGKGTFVCKESKSFSTTSRPILTIPSKSNRLNVFEFRKIIEGESAMLAAFRATYDMVCAMEDSICRMEQGHDNKEIAKQDMAFHHMIAEAAGNEIILQVFESLHDTYENMFDENVAVRGYEGAIDHRKILLAIQTRDMQAAKQHMLDHLDATMRALPITQ